jgi:DNA-binding transcriptional ArsR family regulator
MASLNDIITSRVRVEVLELLYSNTTEMYYVRDIVRRTKEEINSVRRELARLENAGIVKKEVRGNRIYYWVREEYPLYEDLLSLVCKSTGLGAAIIENKTKIGKPSYVMFSGKFAAYKERKREDEVDILVVGEIVLPELATLIRVEESKRAREINYTVMSREEFDFRKKRRDPFLLGILASSRVMIIGTEEGLVG